MLKHLGSMGSLLATVLYNVLFVATVSVAGMGLKNYVRAVELDANVCVAPSSVRDPAVHGRRERPGEGSIALVMVGAKVLFNSAKMLKMGVFVVFMHDYGHQETQRDVTQLFYP